MLEARVNATPQFISLKDMLTKKNAKMKVASSLGLCYQLGGDNISV